MQRGPGLLQMKALKSSKIAGHHHVFTDNDFEMLCDELQRLNQLQVLEIRNCARRVNLVPLAADLHSLTLVKCYGLTEETLMFLAIVSVFYDVLHLSLNNFKLL